MNLLKSISSFERSICMCPGSFSLLPMQSNTARYVIRRSGLLPYVVGWVLCMALIASGVAQGLPQGLGIKESALDGIPQEVVDRIRETLSGIDTPRNNCRRWTKCLPNPS